jgi:RNA polymerase sigma-70 factor, ECF subfamily
VSDSRQHTRTAAPTTASDETLLEQFLLGDDAAYTLLYERFDASVLTYLRTILKDNLDTADDLFQETFVRLFRERKRRTEAPDAYAPIKNVRGWLFRVAHNLAISHHRSNRQSVSLSDGDSDGGAHWDERLMVPIEESFAQIYGEENEMRSESLQEQLRAAIELLPPALREVYLLREVNGLEYDQVAMIAGCTQEAARMRISRARRALRNALERYLGKPE